MSYKVIARKWRPQSLEQVIGQDHITKSLKNSLLSKKIAHAYLFSGPRGVGKTSVARILAKSLTCEKGICEIACQKCSNCIEITNGTSYDILEIDGASNRGIDQIRELRDNVKYLPNKSRFKIFIIDEVHMLTDPAFNALLKTLEEPPKHIIFIFATTEPHKVKITIRSRCQHYHFKHIPINTMQKHIEKIALDENVIIDKNALFKIAKIADGSMRDGQSLLDQLIAYCNNERITAEKVEELLGVFSEKYYIEFISLLVKKDTIGLVKLLSSIRDGGKDLITYSAELVSYFRNLFILKKTDENESSLLGISDEDIKNLPEFVGCFTDKQLIDIINLIISLNQELKKATNQNYLFESYLFRLVGYEDFIHPSTIIKKIEDLEQKLSDASPSLEVEELTIKSNNISEESKNTYNKITLDKESKDWKSFISAIKDKKPFLSSYLEQAQLTIDKNQLLISFKEPLYYEEVSKKENIDKLKDIFNIVFNRNIDIRVIIKDSEDNNSVPNGHNRQSMISSVIKSFKGEIV